MNNDQEAMGGEQEVMNNDQEATNDQHEAMDDDQMDFFDSGVVDSVN